MKEVFWVFRSFGFLAGIFFIWHSIVRSFRRLLNSFSRKRFPLCFEDLSDHDAQMTAWVAGVPDWEKKETRQQLNDAWNEFVRHRTFH